MPTKENPADDSFGGLKDVNSEKTKRWFEGPGLLWKSESEWPTQVSVDVDDSNPEVKAILTVNVAKAERVKARSRVLKLAKIEKSSGDDSTAAANQWL